MSIDSSIAAYLNSHDDASGTARVTLTIDGYLLSRIDKIAAFAERSRSRVFVDLLEEGIRSIENTIRYSTVSDTESVGDSNV